MEATLIKTSTFDLQGRSIPVVKDGQQQKATILSAIVGRSSTSDTAEFRLNENNTDIGNT